MVKAKGYTYSESKNSHKPATYSCGGLFGLYAYYNESQRCHVPHMYCYLPIVKHSPQLSTAAPCLEV